MEAAGLHSLFPPGSSLNSSPTEQRRSGTRERLGIFHLGVCSILRQRVICYSLRPGGTASPIHGLQGPPATLSRLCQMSIDSL